MTAATLKLERRINPYALSLRLAGKLLAFVLMMTVVMGLLMVTIDRAFAGPLLRSDIVVKSAQIKLGDVFDGLEKHADFVLAPAPKPGEELTWNQPTLLRIATAFNLPWQPDMGEVIHIRREGMMIDSETIRAVLRDHLARDDAQAIYNIRFSGDAPQISVEGDALPRLEVVDFEKSAHGDTFSAIIRASAGGASQTVNLRGVAERMVRVPVLRSALSNGTIIGQRDIDYITMRAAELRPGAVLNAEDLLGTTPRRNVSAGQVVRSDDIEKPRMINRGDLITMVFNNSGMILTTKGKALQDGALGDHIRVSNAGSGRQIEARVTNTKEVTVSQ